MNILTALLSLILYMLHESIKTYLAQKWAREIASGMYLFSEVMHVLRLGNYTYYTKKLKLQKLQAIGKVVYQISLEQIIELIIPHYREADLYEMVNTPGSPVMIVPTPSRDDSQPAPITAAPIMAPQAEEPVKKTFAPIIKQELRPDLIRKAGGFEVLDPCGERIETFTHRTPVGETEQVLTLYAHDTLMLKWDVHFVVDERVFPIPLEKFMQWKSDAANMLTSIEDVYPGKNVWELRVLWFPDFPYNQEFLSTVWSMKPKEQEEQKERFKMLSERNIASYNEHKSVPDWVTLENLYIVQRELLKAYEQAAFELRHLQAS